MNRNPATSAASRHSRHLPAPGHALLRSRLGNGEVDTILLRMSRLAGLHAAQHSRPPNSALERLQQAQPLPSRG